MVDVLAKYIPHHGAWILKKVSKWRLGMYRNTSRHEYYIIDFVKVFMSAHLVIS